MTSWNLINEYYCESGPSMGLVGLKWLQTYVHVSQNKIIIRNLTSSLQALHSLNKTKWHSDSPFSIAFMLSWVGSDGELKTDSRSVSDLSSFHKPFDPCSIDLCVCVSCTSTPNKCVRLFCMFCIRSMCRKRPLIVKSLSFVFCYKELDPFLLATGPVKVILTVILAVLMTYYPVAIWFIAALIVEAWHFWLTFAYMPGTQYT